MAEAGFLSHYLYGPKPYAWHHITVNVLDLWDSLIISEQTPWNISKKVVIYQITLKCTQMNTVSDICDRTCHKMSFYVANKFSNLYTRYHIWKNDRNKHGSFCAGLSSQECFLLLQIWAAQPPISVIISRVRCYSIYILDVYVD